MVTLSALAQKNRSAGEYVSPAWKVPDGLKGNITVTFTMPLTDLQNTANRLDCHYEISDDGEKWRMGGGFGWEGGNYTSRTGQILKGPGVFFEAAEIAGKWVRFRINANRPMQIGVDLDQ